MSRVIAAFTQFFHDGVPLSDGWLRFLVSGTNNTNKDTFADIRQTIPNANPVQLDAEGYCPNVFGQGVYRVSLYADDPVLHVPGELLKTFDPVLAEYVSEGSNNSFLEWDSSRDYQVGDIVIHNGYYYRSITANNTGNSPDTTPSDWEQIDVLRFWNTNVTYSTDDIAIYDSQLYFSLADANTGNQPDISPAWWTPVGSGTVLTNWEESGTTFRPILSGYDLGDATNHVGTAYIDDFGIFPETPASAPSTDYEVANKKYVDDIDAEDMHWVGAWVPGTYEANDVVRDDNWTLIANTTTTDRPAPQPVGESEWVSDVFGPASFSTTSASESVLYIGQRYIFDQALMANSLRIWIPAAAVGAHVKVWAVYNPTGSQRIVNLYPGSVIDSDRVDKWLELPFGQIFINSGVIVDVIMVLRSPAQETDFTFSWAYVKSDGDPPAGSIYHQSGANADQIRVHEQDNTLVDRTLNLDNIGPGSKIYMVTKDYTWEVLSASKTGDVYTFIVDPAARSANDTSAFTFTYYGSSALSYVYDTDLYLATSNVRGYFGNEYDGTDAGFLDDNGYGVDLQLQTAIVSDDWEIVSEPLFGAFVGGSGGATLAYWQENSEYFEPVTTGVGFLGNTTKLIEGIYLGDSSPIYLGDAQDATIQFDGTDLALTGPGDLLYNGLPISSGAIISGYATILPGIFWQSRVSAADNDWVYTAYGNGLYVAVSITGTGNRVMTSPDGITWTIRTSAADNDWKSVVYGNGLYVAVSSTGTGNRVMTSPDGITWTIRTSAADNQWTSVTYGNGLYVAVSKDGTGNRVMTSPDGITWTIRTSAADNKWQCVTYGNGLYVAVSNDGIGNRVMTSPDGITWTIRTSAADNQWIGVTYGNGLYVAVSITGTGNRVMTSPDGITWTIRTSAADNDWFMVAYGNGLYVAVARTGTNNRVMTSTDGINWATRYNPVDNQWNGVAYGNNIFVAVSITGSGDRAMMSAAIPIQSTGQIELDPAPDDLSYSGMYAIATVDTNATGIGAALYMASDGNYDEADASATTTMPCSALALETGTGSKMVLRQGYLRDDTWAWTPGGLLYVSATTGSLTQTAPSGTGEQVQVVGHAVTADIVYFSPNYVLAEVA